MPGVCMVDQECLGGFGVQAPSARLVILDTASVGALVAAERKDS